MKDKSAIYMAGTSMGSGIEMCGSCGSQVRKHMGGPKMMGGDSKKGFRQAFATNRKAGKSEFKYGGKMYNTKTAEDVAKGLNDKDLYKAYDKAYSSVSSFENVPGSEKLKSRVEIEDSYYNEGRKRQAAKASGAKMMGKKSCGK